jgi:hypothetical protein
MVPILAAKGRLGALLTGYVELIGRQLLPPFVVRFVDVVRHDYQLE